MGRSYDDIMADRMARMGPEADAQREVLERNYDIAVNVIRCEGVKGNGGDAVARFTAVVEITTAGEGGGQVVARKVFHAPDVPWDGKDYGALAEALSAGVGALCEDLVAALPEKK